MTCWHAEVQLVVQLEESVILEAVQLLWNLMLQIMSMLGVLMQAQLSEVATRGLLDILSALSEKPLKKRNPYMTTHYNSNQRFISLGTKRNKTLHFVGIRFSIYSK